jgi:hypothetical protein
MAASPRDMSVTIDELRHHWYLSVAIAASNPNGQVVPKLTCIANVKLNEQVRLQRLADEIR